MHELKWVKPSKCNNSACVEVAFSGDDVLVRHSTGNGPILTFTKEEWAAFIGGVENGEFNAG